MKFAGYEITELSKGEIRALVPSTAEPLMSLLPLDQVLALMDAFGGTDVWMPAQPTNEHPVARVIGKDSFEQLRRGCCMEKLHIPRGRRLRCALRDAEIRALHRAGHSTADIAKRVNLTERMVRYVIHEYLEVLASRGVSPEPGS